MATATEPTPQSDLEEICRLIAEGRKVTDPQLLKRVWECAEPGDSRGVRAAWAVNVAVDLIRDGRDEE